MSSSIVYLYACMYVCMYVCVYVFLRLSTLPTHILISLYIYIHTYIHIYIYTHLIHRNSGISIYIYTSVPLYIYIYLYVYAFVRRPSRRQNKSAWTRQDKAPRTRHRRVNLLPIEIEPEIWPWQASASSGCGRPEGGSKVPTLLVSVVA